MIMIIIISSSNSSSITRKSEIYYEMKMYKTLYTDPVQCQISSAGFAC